MTDSEHLMEIVVKLSQTSFLWEFQLNAIYFNRLTFTRDNEKHVFPAPALGQELPATRSSKEILHSPER